MSDSYASTALQLLPTKTPLAVVSDARRHTTPGILPIGIPASVINGRMSGMLRSEDAVEVMTSLLLYTAKIRIHAAELGNKIVAFETTTKCY